MQEADQRDPRAYVRVAATLYAQIAGGRLAPGDKLPSITMLAREGNMSRQTVAKGLQLLERDGVVRRVAGHGYFVRAGEQDR